MGRDKALVEVGDLPAVVHVGRIVAEICAPVVVVATPGQALPFLPPPLRRVDDPAAHTHEGPLRGLHTGLRALADAGIPLAYLGACDAIALSSTHVAFVLDRLADDDAVEAVAPTDGARVHPLAAAVRVTPALAAASALLAAGRRAATALIEALRVARVAVADLPDPAALAEANTPAQWAVARRTESR
jgi:molybdopterin-guanine dinucleotide biosynthesis protein A